MLYLVMLAVLVGGTWTILRAGSSLRPPTDISGPWILTDDPSGSLVIRQSGRFVRLSLDGGSELHLRWTQHAPAAGAPLGELIGAGVEMRLWELPARQDLPPPSAPTHLLEARGAIEASWHLRRAPAPSRAGRAGRD